MFRIEFFRIKSHGLERRSTWGDFLPYMPMPVQKHMQMRDARQMRMIHTLDKLAHLSWSQHLFSCSLAVPLAMVPSF